MKKDTIRKTKSVKISVYVTNRRDMTKELNAIYVIWLRELVRYWRSRIRAVSGIMMPLLWLVVLGSGLASSLKFSPQESGSGAGLDYLSFIFPGVMAMAILFPSVFSALTIVYDREFGFFKEIFVAPISRTSIVIGKTLGGATTTTFQASLMFVLAPFIGIHVPLLTVGIMIPAIFLIAFGFSAFGVLVAARMKSTESFPMVMQFMVMPMFFLAGAMFPLRDAPPWMNALSKFDPLTYGVDLLRSLYFKGLGVNLPFGITVFGRPLTPLLDVIILCGIVVVLMFFSVKLFGKTE